MAPSTAPLNGISEIRAFFRTNRTPIYFVSPTAFNLLGIDRWLRSFFYVNYFDSFEGSHPRVFVPKDRSYSEFTSMEDVCNHLLGHKEVLDRIEHDAVEGTTGKAVFVMFDDETEACAAAAGLEVAIHQGDLLDAVPDGLRGRVDLVVSNPPYLAADALEELSDEVRADPELALVGGLPVYVRLADAAAGVVRPGGGLAVEIGETQARDVAEVLRDAGWTAVATEQDLTGRDRVIVASRAR